MGISSPIPIRLFRPCNGTEADSFIGKWCERCARDRALREGVPIEECDDDEVCEIVGRTFRYDLDDPRYPSEWRYSPLGNPMCTAFVPAGDQVPPPRCAFTLELPL